MYILSLSAFDENSVSFHREVYGNWISKTTLVELYACVHCIYLDWDVITADMQACFPYIV